MVYLIYFLLINVVFIITEVSFLESVSKQKRIKNIEISSSTLSRVIKDLNPNKAHRHENIPIKMIQIWGDSIIPPLKIIFESAIWSNHFPDSWKKGNIIPVHKKEGKNIWIFGKILEKTIYYNLFEYFQENKFLSDNRSGFRMVILVFRS